MARLKAREGRVCLRETLIWLRKNNFRQLVWDKKLTFIQILL